MADELEAIRKKKMMDYMAMQQTEAAQAMRRQAQLEAELKKLMLGLLDRDAMSRLNTIRTTKPEFAMQIEIALFQLFQAGKIKPVITDAQLRQILQQIVPEKRETKIMRK